MLSKKAKQLSLSLTAFFARIILVFQNCSSLVHWVTVPRMGTSRLQRVARDSPPPLPLRRWLELALFDPRVTVWVVPENQADQTLLFFF
ncbi:hypothetical protein BJY01DRAFT_229748 [Aspergillus pseudoustus]|uniref:Secreted protein n=1 Tax=Aspergillus pseudoustus TaxID=1810923 RepID=A0ABR4IF25_9EURO